MVKTCFMPRNKWREPLGRKWRLDLAEALLRACVSNAIVTGRKCPRAAPWELRESPEWSLAVNICAADAYGHRVWYVDQLNTLSAHNSKDGNSYCFCGAPDLTTLERALPLKNYLRDFLCDRMPLYLHLAARPDFSIDQITEVRVVFTYTKGTLDAIVVDSVEWQTPTGKVYVNGVDELTFVSA